VAKSRGKKPNACAPFKIQMTEISTNGPNKFSNKKSNNTMDPGKPRQSICLQKNLDLSGNSSDRSSEMGEGENGSSHHPLPKVVVRSEDDP